LTTQGSHTPHEMEFSITNISPLRRFWKLLENHKKEIRQIHLYAILNGFVNLSLPLGIQAIINYIIVGEVTVSWMILVSFVLIGIALNGVFQVLQLRIVENIQQDVFNGSAFNFAYRLPKVSQDQLDQNHVPELVNRFFDTLTIQKGLPKILIDFSLSAFTIFFGLILLSIYSPYFILLAISLFILLWIIFRLTGKAGLKTSLKESKYKYNVAHWLEEVARVNRSFKLSGSSNLHLRKTDELTTGYLHARENHFKILLSQFKYIIGFKIFLAAGLLILGGLLVIENQMNIGQFVAAEIIIILIINAVEKVLRVIETIYDVLTALDKIGAISDLNLDEDEGRTALSVQPLALEMENGTFAFPEEESPVFQHLNLRIPANEKVVITGPSGSGKTILLQILAGIYHLTEGRLLINDAPIQHYQEDSYFNLIGVSFPSNELFEGSIRENITMGREISEKDIFQVIHILNLGSFISSLSKGLEHQIDSGGRRLPRSVIQRLTMARALAHNPKLLILEDPMMFVESSDRHKIINYLMSPEFACTVVVVADHDEWNQEANQIIQLIKD